MDPNQTKRPVLADRQQLGDLPERVAALLAGRDRPRSFVLVEETPCGLVEVFAQGFGPSTPRPRPAGPRVRVYTHQGAGP